MAKAQTETFQIDAILACSTAAYSAGDAVGDLIELSLEGQLQDPVKSGILGSVAVIDNDQQSASLDLEFFAEEPSAQTDNAAVAFTKGDALKWIGRVSINAADYKDIGSSHCAIKSIADTGFQVKIPDAESSLYMQVIARGTATYSLEGPSFKVGILMD